MSTFDHRKYRPFPPIQITDRTWPDRSITHAPRWCSVDLRDGNQALVEPMTVTQKTRLFEQLLRTGFKEIEVGFPAASEQEFSFIRHLIEGDMIPPDVTIQVLTAARTELIERTFEALQGAPRAIVHLYNSTSKIQREMVFQGDRQAITKLATDGARAVRRCASRYPETDWIFQYSPESFTGTEPDYAVEICNAVSAIWQPSPARPVIINLPATVEMSTPNVFADQIEWFCQHVDRRESLIISLHTHNDRGCAVAAAELGLLAGADRVEGTLLGNGERTGNMDIVTMAMNLYSQGIDPRLDLHHLDEVIRTVQDCTGLPVHPRHPYAGELVFTAFSGSHQDAIRKCLGSQQQESPWEVAYLPIDPRDLGRSYQELIRINSQSGKGGIAHVLERDHGVVMPRWLQIDFSKAVQYQAEQRETEITSDTLWQLFEERYLLTNRPWQLLSYQLIRTEDKRENLSAELRYDHRLVSACSSGRGVLDAFTQALQAETGTALTIIEYSEHTLAQSNDAQAIAYVQLSVNKQRRYGVARSRDIAEASMMAVLSALNQPDDEAVAA